MKGLYPNPRGAAEARENWRLVGQAADDCYYRRWLVAANGEPVAPAAKALVGPGTGPLPGFLMPDAASSNYRWIVPLDPLVGPSYARITFWYTAPVGAVANFNLTWTVTSYDTVGTLATVGTTGSLGYPGPAVATAFLQGGPFVLSTLPFQAGRHICIRAIVIRDGVADANNGDFHFVQALLEMLPR